jgi:hypothetical protein
MRDFVLKDLPLGVGWKTSPRKGNILLSSSKSFFPITGMPAASHRIPRDSDEGTNGCDDQVMAGGRKVASSFDSHLRNCLKSLVPLAGLEPARCFHHLILSLFSLMSHSFPRFPRNAQMPCLTALLV